MKVQCIGSINVTRQDGGGSILFAFPDSYMGVETMSMRGVAVTVSLVGAFLHVLLEAQVFSGAEANGSAFSFVQQVKLTEQAKVAEDQFGGRGRH